MDNSFSDSLFTGAINTGSGGGNIKGSSFASRTRQSLASSSATSTAISNRKSIQGGLSGGNVFKKGPGSSRYSLSGRSTQSTQIIAKSENFIVESYGLPLPVLVNEALTFSERNAQVSINCSSTGWIWAVCGRRLLVWQYKENQSQNQSPKLNVIRTPQRRIPIGQFRELTLPHCDIGHKATLATVFLSDGQQMASCLAVSPTGDVRYWPSIAHDGSSVDLNGILEGQEFDELISIAPLGYILATTTCNLVWLQLQHHNGRHTIVHRTIKPPGGFLGGIGKKFASIIIGMNSNQDKEHKFIKVCAEQSKNGDWNVAVLADRYVQRWCFTNNGNETFLFEDVDIFRKIRDIFHQKLWCNRDPTEVEIRLIDMQAMETKIYILAAAINPSHTPQIYFALITLVENGPSYSINSYCQIKHTLLFTGNTTTDNLKMKFILNRGVAYIYDDKVIYQMYLNDLSGSDTEKIEFPSHGDKIMTAIIHLNLPLFFSRLYGLVCITPSDLESPEYFNSSISSDVFGESPFSSQSYQQRINLTSLPAGGGSDFGTIDITTTGAGSLTTNLSMYDLNPDEIYDETTTTTAAETTIEIGKSKLKAAFIYHLKKNSLKCSEILEEMFTNDSTIEQPCDLDGIVLSIAKDLADDMPAADPRWEEQIRQISTIKKMDTRYSLGSSMSMQIIQQLRDKQLALTHFLEFLHAVDMWDRLGTVTINGNMKSTCYLLSDISEKITAAFSLRRIHNSYSRIIDEAIQVIVKQRNDRPTGGLTPQDLFYVKTTQIHEIFIHLANVSTDLNNGNSNSQTDSINSTKLSTKLIDINTIILTVLSDILKYRETKHRLFQLPSSMRQKFDYLPWTAASGKYGIRDSLQNLITITLKYGARSTVEPELRQKHYKQMVELIDFVLDSRKCYLDSIGKNNDKHSVMLQQFESQRSDLIFPLVQDKQYELATKLAEKYLDFQILVQICDQTENQIRLDEYIEKFKELNFSQFAINWHLRQNKRGDLFERFKRNQSDLTKFLTDHPSLAWIQSIFNGEMSKASKILFDLAQSETELIARKKTMLSLAKLASLASEDDLDEQITQINCELALIVFQENIPEHLLGIFGYDCQQQKVLRPEEIINLLIAEENEHATEADYRKALELLPYVEDPIGVRHKIWCSAILRDDWSTYNVNSPQDDLQNMLFTKLIDLCFFMDVDNDDLVPPIEEFLNAPELEALTTDKSFQFLFKLNYEYIGEYYKRK